MPYSYSFNYAQKSVKQEENVREKYFSRRGFTLVEMLVALTVFMLLMVIIFVPLSMALDSLHVGRTEATLRGDTQSILTKVQEDLKRAIYVFPNAEVPTVTGTATNPRAPYIGVSTAVDYDSMPYFEGDPCNDVRASNFARIDMLLPEVNNHDSVLAPVIPTFYIVTYYARRLDIAKPYQPVRNPIVLFRAQIPFRGDPSCEGCMIDGNGDAVQPAPSAPIYPASASLNASIFDGRYANLSACATNAAAVNRSAEWLTQSADGEPNLEPLTEGATDVFKLYGSHTNMLGEGMGLNTSAGFRDSPISYKSPDTSFTVRDTTGSGRVNQVTIRLSLYKLSSEEAYSGQKYALSKVVNLPDSNVRVIPDVR